MKKYNKYTESKFKLILLLQRERFLEYEIKEEMNIEYQKDQGKCKITTQNTNEKSENNFIINKDNISEESELSHKIRQYDNIKIIFQIVKVWIRILQQKQFQL